MKDLENEKNTFRRCCINC